MSITIGRTHFYSPIVDPTDEQVRAVEVEASPQVDVESVGFDPSDTLRWLAVIADVCKEMLFPAPSKPPLGNFAIYSNPHFPLADALALFAMIKEHKPRRYIEVGCGYSSCAAIDINDHHVARPMAMTFIDPHPELFLSLLEPDSHYRDNVVTKRIQDVPLDVFRELGDGDILFIDSSHVVKTGSDVVDYMFRILPMPCGHFCGRDQTTASFSSLTGSTMPPRFDGRKSTVVRSASRR